MFYSAAAVRTEWSGRLHFIFFLRAAKKPLSRLPEFGAKKHPPTRSIGEWGAHPLIGLVSPQNLWALRGPGSNSNGQAKPAHFKVLPFGQNACTPHSRRTWTVSFAFWQKTSPHSLHRRMGGSPIDRTVHWSVPLTFTNYRSDTNLLGESGKLWELPILKTALHADICSGLCQNVLVWLIIVSVFRLWGCFQKLLAVDAYSIPNGFWVQVL